MIHEMNLQPEAFYMILSGKKIYELRLYDEKRQKIRPGDLLVFSMENSEQMKLKVKVEEVLVYSSFEELYASLPMTQIGYDESTAHDASFHDMDAYYPPEKQKQYEVVALKIKKL